MMIYCPKTECKHNDNTVLFDKETGICQLQELRLEEYPSKDKPAACADYDREER